MLRSILGAIAGYVIMFFIIFLPFSAAYLALGADGAFVPGGYDVSMTWIVVSFVLGFLAALVAGYAAAVIGKGSTAVKILAGIVVVLGIVSAVAVSMSAKPEGPRTAGVSRTNSSASMGGIITRWRSSREPSSTSRSSACASTCSRP